MELELELEIHVIYAVLRDPDPETGVFWPLDLGSGFGIRDSKKSSRSGMNIPDNCSVSLETVFRFKILKFIDPDPGSGIFLTLCSRMEKFGSRIRDKHPGSATLNLCMVFCINKYNGKLPVFLWHTKILIGNNLYFSCWGWQNCDLLAVCDWLRSTSVT